MAAHTGEPTWRWENSNCLCSLLICYGYSTNCLNLENHDNCSNTTAKCISQGQVTLAGESQLSEKMFALDITTSRKSENQ